MDEEASAVGAEEDGEVVIVADVVDSAVGAVAGEEVSGVVVVAEASGVVAEVRQAVGVDAEEDVVVVPRL